MNSIKLDLVNNTYEIDQAKEVLMQLLTDKINFLKRKRFSSEIRYGISPTNVEGRLEELLDAREQLKAFFSQLQNSHYEVEIDCPISIKLHELDSESNTNTLENSI